MHALLPGRADFPLQIHEETGASITTKGVWYPDRSKATDRDPPLYLHVTANTEETLKKAVDKINDLINTDLGPLVEDKKDRVRERVRDMHLMLLDYTDAT